MTENGAQNLRILIANERRDRLELLARVVGGLGHDVIAREVDIKEIGAVTAYPAEYFYPYPWFGRYSPECVREEAYCIHHWEGTWNKSEYCYNALKRATMRAKATLTRPFSLFRLLVCTE